MSGNTNSDLQTVSGNRDDAVNDDSNAVPMQMLSLSQPLHVQFQHVICECKCT